MSVEVPSLTYPIRAPASPRISMPPKLGLPHSPIRRVMSHKRDSHSRTAHARGVLPTTCTRRMHGFGFCLSASQGQTVFGLGFDTICLTLQLRLRVSTPP